MEKKTKKVSKIKNSKKIKVMSSKEKRDIKTIEANPKNSEEIEETIDFNNIELSAESLQLGRASPVLGQIAIQSDLGELEQGVANSIVNSSNAGEDEDQIDYNVSKSEGGNSEYISSAGARTNLNVKETPDYNPNSRDEGIKTMDESTIHQRDNQRINEGFARQRNEDAFDPLGESRKERERNKDLAGISEFANSTSEYHESKSDKEYYT